MYALCDILDDMGKNMESTTLAEQVREAIRRSGWTRNRLAKTAGVEYSALWRFMAGESNDPTCSTVDKLCKALGLRIELRPRGQRNPKG
jgi:transcriptional regulator with XRE-family HTH domain